MKRRRIHSWFCLSLYFKYALSYYAHTQLLADYSPISWWGLMGKNLNVMETKLKRSPNMKPILAWPKIGLPLRHQVFFFHQLCSKVTRTAFLIYCRLILQQLLSWVVHNGVIFFMNSQLNSDKCSSLYSQDFWRISFLNSRKYVQ